MNWRFEHIGGGEELPRLKALATTLGVADRITWKGALAQDDVLDHYRRSDIFALACRIAANGDRDGLPNVLVEASSQRLVCVSTSRVRRPGTAELTERTDLLVPPEDPVGIWPWRSRAAIRRSRSCASALGDRGRGTRARAISTITPASDS